MIGETTRKCIRIILKHGGQIAPKYDPTTITHIVLESGLPKANLLEAAHVKTLERIPEHIPLLAWKWVNVLQNMNPDIEPGRPPQEIHLIADEHLYNYGHFSSRLPPVNLHPSAVARTQLRLRKSTNSEFSHISRYPEDVSDSDGSEAPLPIYRQPHGMERPLKAASSRVPLNLQPVHADNTSDPLLAFYLRARENNSLFPRYRNEFDSGTETETSDTETSAEDTSKLKEKRQDGGWLCKDPQKRAAPCPNDDVIEKLEELKTLHSAKPAEDDKWRVFSLNKSTSLTPLP
ncbi:hypothetical protein D9757_014585 [Collybiopsis confluens]|uniref:BRCT domain-containing protein n=1 Tax=Collybiopsis confluens TaxID=2823264 RepID=A0A8H5CPD4_9AGAR|nr:hypothetical protein D9757_014585 [Collybiopsis confluens]